MRKSACLHPDLLNRIRNIRRTIYVHLFWAELKGHHRIDELGDDKSLEEPWGGIGVLHV